MKQEDEEFEKLLGEIPHVTNGASHRASSTLVGQGPVACTSGENISSKCTANQKAILSGSDLFGQFFSAFQVNDGLQQCDGGHLHSQSYSGIMAGIMGVEDCSKLTPRGVEIKQRLPTVDEEGEEPLASLGFAESDPHELPDDASLIAAFEEATLEVEPAARNLLQGPDTIKSTKIRNENDMKGESMRTSSGSSHHVEFTQGTTVSTDLSKEAISPIVTNNMRFVPKKFGLSTACANVQPFSGPCRQEVYANSNSSHTRHTYPSGGLMFPYPAAIRSAPVGTMKNSVEYSRGHVDPLYFGDSISAPQRVVAFPHCNGVNGHVHENNGSVYYSSGSFNEVAGSNVDSHHSEIVDRLQMSPSNFYNLQQFSQQAEAQTNYFHYQQDVHQDSSIPLYCQGPKACKMQPNWQSKEEERQRIQLLSHSQALDFTQQYLGPPFHPHACSVPSFYAAADRQCRPVHVSQIADMTDWELQSCPRDLGRLSAQGFVPQMAGDWALPMQESGSRGDTCSIVHTKARNVVKSRPFKIGAASPCGDIPVVPQEKPAFCPVRILSRESPRAATTVVTVPCVDKSIETIGHRRPSADAFTNDTRLLLEKQRLSGSLLETVECTWPKGQMASQGKYSSLEEVEGHIYSVAKDQHGCRFLQRQFDEGGPKEVERIFVEIIDHILELMTDPFGNYLVQKLLDVCNEDQRLKILIATTANGELINVSLNMHGTRAVQKLIETLTTSQQVSMVTASLRPGVVMLIKDLNGNHVIQRCLQHLSSEDSQFIFEVVTSHCVEIATHRHGCCVLQRCIDFSSGTPQQKLISEIAANALLLSQDPFGNYVVQYVLDLGIPWVSMKVIEQLAGHFAHLSMQKFSSNVVEKCLKFADEEHKSKLIRELMEDSHLLELLQDPYANYVIQSALMVSKGNLHTNLVDAICPHTPFLRSSPYGKRILSRRNLKKC